MAVALAIGLFASTAVAVLSGQQYIEHRRLALHGQVAEGRLTAIRPKEHQTVRYTFHAAGRAYEGVDQGVGAVGDAVQVTYLPSDPTVSTLDDPAREAADDRFALFFVAPALLVLVTAFMSWRLRSYGMVRIDSPLSLPKRPER
jgi:YD repeat-containing protein